MKKSLLSLVLGVFGLLCTVARAQPIELYGGYNFQYMRANDTVSLNGWTAAVQVGLPHLPLLPHLSAVGEVSGNYGTYNNPLNPVSLDEQHYTFLAGPRLTQNFRRFKTFEHVLVGAGRIKEGYYSESYSQTRFASALGGGLDVRVSKHLSVRPAQVDYLMTRYGTQGVQNNIRYSAGLVWGL